MPCYAIDGVIPVVDPSAFIHPTAVLIGDVHIGPDVYIGPLASLRADFGRIVVGRGANIQDACVVHGFPDHDTVIEEDGHIGHAAVLHSCLVRRGALVGMNAVVMDAADIGAEAIVAASAFVPAGMVVAPRSLVAGMPAVHRRTVTDEEAAWKHAGTVSYQKLVQRCHASLREVQPLTIVESDRPALRHGGVQPLITLRKGQET